MTGLRWRPTTKCRFQPDAAKLSPLRYKGHLTHKNLANLLTQTNDDDGSDMFEMELYQDDDDSDYDLVLVEYLSLNRNTKGVAAFGNWRLNFGVSPTTTKTANQLYALLKAEIQEEMADEGINFWYVYLDSDAFNSQVSTTRLCNSCLLISPPAT